MDEIFKFFKSKYSGNKIDELLTDVENLPENYWQRPNLILSKENDGAFNIINPISSKAGIRFIYDNEGTEQRLGFFGYDTSNGITLFNQTANYRIGLTDTGEFYYCKSSYRLKENYINIIQTIKDLQSKVKELETKITELQTKVG